MCGRYWMDEGDEALAEIIAQMQRVDSKVKLYGEVCPGDHAPVICRSRSGKPMVYPMEWGFRMANGKRVINARSETACDRPLFQESMLLRRCLLPMSAYYEWEKRGRDRIRYRIRPEEAGLCCLAGIYRYEEDRPVFTVLTQEAAPEIRFIHPRMPVILPYNEREAWLESGVQPAHEAGMTYWADI